MVALSLFWNTNMTAMTSCSYAPFRQLYKKNSVRVFKVIKKRQGTKFMYRARPKSLVFSSSFSSHLSLQSKRREKMMRRLMVSFSISLFRCILRILDSFGTDAEFNCPEYPSDVADFGGLDIHLRQMLTMFRKILFKKATCYIEIYYHRLGRHVIKSLPTRHFILKTFLSFHIGDIGSWLPSTHSHISLMRAACSLFTRSLDNNFLYKLRTTLFLFSFSVASAHSPDNLFLGFAIGKAVSMETSQGTSSNHTTKPGDKPIGLLYAKDAWFLSVSKISIVFFCEFLVRYLYSFVNRTPYKLLLCNWNNVISGAAETSRI